MTERIAALIAGVPVTDLDDSIDWYTRFFGRAPDMVVGEEILWDVDERATLFIERDPGHAGAGRITFAVEDLDALLVRLCRRRHRPRADRDLSQRRAPYEGPRSRRKRPRLRRTPAQRRDAPANGCETAG